MAEAISACTSLHTLCRHCRQQRRRCGHCAIIANYNAVVAGITPSLRATTRNTAAAKKTSNNNATITDKAPSLRALRVIAGNDPQHNSSSKKNVKQQTKIK